MANSQIKGDYDGIGELLKCEGIRDLIGDIAEQIAIDAAIIDNSDYNDYETDVVEGTNRVRGRVTLRSDTDAYWRDVKKFNGLSKAASKKR